ncbi:beta-lactamase/transpeptidase-like protein [Lophiotrema nucula]|uniref:Beta-lactamase/transpeptidase-like protein n=1 Tax=Lophiotrema nucula TaxID=690887 RepID=A0A6A5ZCT5_9PLEO|nr:beta-lactamase/transpeptidase-like protein [Lophiotrema nucula]
MIVGEVMAFDAHRIRSNLAHAHKVINSIQKTSGAPGLAIGIIHGGQIVHEDYRGHRDLQTAQPVTRETIFHVASLTKAITAAAIGILVDRGDLAWDTPVGALLPIADADKSQLTMVDFLSHRTGVTWADALYLQSNNSILLPKEESLRTFEYLPLVTQPRTRFLYNNHGYNIPGLVIEHLTKQSYGEFVHQNVFCPLDMTRTFTSQALDTNVAMPYNILSDGTPFPIPFCDVNGETMMFSGISVRTCMADLLRLYQAYLGALEPLIPVTRSRQAKPEGLFAMLGRRLLNSFTSSAHKNACMPRASATEESKASTNVIRQAPDLFRPQISKIEETLFEQTHALGWNRSQLPAKLDFGWNSEMVASMPLLGLSMQGRLAVWHGGNMPGTTAAVILLPETGTAVVVLQNSLGLCDAADWIAQLLVDCIFAGKPQHDYAKLAEEAVFNGISRMIRVQQQLDHDQQHGTSCRPYEEYIGVYENSIKNWAIEIAIVTGKGLCLRFQRRAHEEYQLRHYHYDVFVWNLSYDELVKRGQYIRPYTYYKLEFENGSDSSIQFLRWRHDPNVPDGEIFTKACGDKELQS